MFQLKTLKIISNESQKIRKINLNSTPPLPISNPPKQHIIKKRCHHKSNLTIIHSTTPGKMSSSYPDAKVVIHKHLFSINK